jgi:putative nucleotidyltransferase with HDIG domain
MPNFGELVLFYMVPALSGMLVLGQGRRISIFFLAGLVVGVAGSGSIIALRILGNQTDLIGIFTLVLASLFNGMASASLGLLVQYIIAQFLGITTALQLLEIARPDHPLLQHILKKAPGTYQHSLQVANLAEQAAKEIGADQLLTRVGAIYHDAGKTVNPSFFIENQVNGASNPHDALDPYTSAATVIEHVTNGVELAKKYHLPLRIQNFMLEHHGTLVTRYFYVKAVENNGNDESSVSKFDFMYPGPPPQSKETALLMLADGCEARARAEKPQSKEELLVVIQKVIDFCQKEGQLNDTELTLKDLKTIANSFTDTLINTYHPRIKYPELIKQPVTSEPS